MSRETRGISFLFSTRFLVRQIFQFRLQICPWGEVFENLKSLGLLTDTTFVTFFCLLRNLTPGQRRVKKRYGGAACRAAPMEG